VVGKLAARHAVRVALRPSPYGGTTAVVLMPNSIVVPMSATEADTDPDLRLAAGRKPGLDLHHADALVLTGRHSAQPSLPEGVTGETETADGGSGLVPGFPAGSAAAGSAAAGSAAAGSADAGSADAGLAPMGTGLSFPGTGFGSAGAGLGSPGTGLGSTGIAPVQRGLGRPPSLPGQDTQDPADAGDDPGLAPGLRTAGTYRGLPRRVRQASLNPRLKDTPSAARGGKSDSIPPAGGRSPEEARSVVSSMQNGWQRGREDNTDGESAAAAQTAWRPDSEAPQGEEALWTSRARRPGPDSN
jgi:hypothetical protein